MKRRRGWEVTGTGALGAAGLVPEGVGLSADGRAVELRARVELGQLKSFLRRPEAWTAAAPRLVLAYDVTAKSASLDGADATVAPSRAVGTYLTEVLAGMEVEITAWGRCGWCETATT